MSAHGTTFLVACVGALVFLSIPLGAYMARVYQGEARIAGKILGPVERGIYRLGGVSADAEMSWRRYAVCLLVFNALGLIVVYALQRLQHVLPLNPAGFGPVGHDVAFNTTTSFVSNTNWQAYGGESTMSHLTQMLALTVQNFVSAATGMAVLVALVRGFVRRQAATIGNFWVDLTRSTLYILVPLSLVLAVVLVSQGVVQTFVGSVDVPLLDPAAATDPAQHVALGPVASQVAIKQLGTNGGGFFNVNSAHPLENPTPFSNLLELLAILLIPGALCFTFGRMLGDRRQGWAVFATMLVLLVPLTVVCVAAEEGGNPAFAALGVADTPGELAPGGNMEGKEVRFGPAESATWAAFTTAASNGSVNSMHDSFTPLGGMVPLFLIQLGEVAFGGVGSGLYGLILFALIAVFLAGLMVGRTPEYLGKKIEAREMKLASLSILLPSAAVLVGTAIACLGAWGTGTLGNPGAHGFSEILYAFTSGSQNNGSAFGGITVSGTFYAHAIGICMLIGRYGVLLPVLAIAGSLAAKRSIPPSAGTLPTHRPLFIGLLAGTVILVGALTYVPALALGPIVEHLQQRGGAP